MGHIIAVLSGKGGTGKTTFSAGVSAALVRAGKTVLAVDCCPGLPELDLALGASNLAALNFMEVSRGDYSLSQATRHPEIPGLSFLTAPFRETDAEPGLLHAMLAQAAEQFDFVLLDGPAGLNMELTVPPAHRVIVLTNPEPGALRGAVQVAERLEKMGKKEVSLVVNRVKKRLFSRPAMTVDDMMDETGLPLLGLIPEEADLTDVTKQANRGTSRAFEAIARRLMGESVPLTIH